MSLDYRVYFTERPELSNVLAMLEDFLGTMGHVEKTGEGNSQRLMAFLHGKNRLQEMRCFEVVFSMYRFFDQADPKPWICVVTYQADEFTNALADQFAKILARRWQGMYIPPES